MTGSQKRRSLVRNSGGSGSPPPVTIYTNWDSAKTAIGTLSTGDSVFTSTGINGITGLVKQLPANKGYAEVQFKQVASPSADSDSVAIWTGGAYGAYLGQNVEAYALYTSGNVYHNVTTTPTTAVWGGSSATDIIQIAWDFTGVTGKVWFGLNGTFSGNPVAGTGAAATAIPLTPSWYIAGYTSANGGAIITERADPANMTYTPPTGFTAGIPQ